MQAIEMALLDTCLVGNDLSRGIANFKTYVI